MKNSLRVNNSNNCCSPSCGFCRSPIFSRKFYRNLKPEEVSWNSRLENFELIQNTQKGLENLRRLTITQILENKRYTSLVWRTLDNNNNNNNNNRDTIKLAEMNEKNDKLYLNRTRKLLGNKVHCRNLIRRNNTWAVLLAKYSRPFLKWTREELQQMVHRKWKNISQSWCGKTRKEVNSKKENNRSVISFCHSRLHNNQWITFLTQPCLLLYLFSVIFYVIFWMSWHMYHHQCLSSFPHLSEF